MVLGLVVPSFFFWLVGVTLSQTPGRTSHLMLTMLDLCSPLLWTFLRSSAPYLLFRLRCAMAMIGEPCLSGRNIAPHMDPHNVKITVQWEPRTALSSTIRYCVATLLSCYLGRAIALMFSCIIPR